MIGRKITAAVLVGWSLVGAVGPAKADVQGCTVILCLASPTGWAGIAECVGPVSAYIKQSKKSKSRPSCPEGESSSAFEVVDGVRYLVVTGADGSQTRLAVPLTATLGQ
jgi:hypothetical protein